MKQATIAIILFVIVTSCPGSVLCLEALSQGQMKQSVAQAGISLAISDLKAELFSGITLSTDPDVNTTNHISFDFRGLISGDLGATHIDVGSLTLDNQAFLCIENNNSSLRTDIILDDIRFSGTSIGSLSAHSELSAFHVYIGLHEGPGIIDYELGFGISDGGLSFNALDINGIYFAHTFTGPLVQPNDWSPEGEFQIGDIKNNKPATFDIQGDTQTSWTMKDSNGDSYSVTNPRSDSTYVVLGMPMSGSFRINNISSGATNMGLLAADGIDIQKLNIEIPGRGLGKP